MKYKFIKHYASSNWGKSILIMEEKGRAFGRIYWYNDDNSSVYLDMLSVKKNSRKKGLGTLLQNIREKIGIKSGAKISWLSVDKNSWMHTWYMRRGYTDCEYNVNEENMIWMKKILITNE